MEILAVQEHWLSKSHKFPESNIEGYKEFWAVRPTRKRGGCSLYISHSMTILKHEVVSNDYCAAVMAKIKELNCIVISLYRPPEAPIPSFIEITNTIREWLEGENSEVVILGDFDLPDWEPGRTLKLTYFVREQTRKKKMNKDLRQDPV